MAVKINSRASWSARRPRCRTAQNPHNIRRFVIHWPADMRDVLKGIDTDREQDAYMRAIQDFHMGPDREWCDFAYSFAVFQDGEIYRGRGLRSLPSAQLNANTNTIAVLCVVGDQETPSLKMIQSLVALKDHCDKICGRDLQAIGHGQIPGQQSECPGPRVRAIVSRIGKH